MWDEDVVIVVLVGQEAVLLLHCLIPAIWMMEKVEGGRVGFLRTSRRSTAL
jgi:hypothetical protein